MSILMLLRNSETGINPVLLCVFSGICVSLEEVNLLDPLPPSSYLTVLASRSVPDASPI